MYNNLKLLSFVLLLAACFAPTEHNHAQFSKVKEKVKIGKKDKASKGGADTFWNSTVGLSSSGAYGTKQLHANSKEKDGLEILDFIAAKGMSKGTEVFSLKQSKDLSAICGQKIYTIDTRVCLTGVDECLGSGFQTVRVHCPEPDIMIFHTGKEIDIKGGGDFYRPLKDITIPLVIAKDPSKIELWKGEPGLKAAQEIENKINAAASAKGNDKLDAVRMPKAGKMHNSANEKIAQDILAPVLKQDGATLHRIVVTADDYLVNRNKSTGIITGRQLWGYFAETNKNGDCVIHTFTISQSHNGSDFAGAWKLDGIAQDPKFGPYISCDNIHK